MPVQVRPRLPGVRGRLCNPRDCPRYERQNIFGKQAEVCIVGEGYRHQDYEEQKDHDCTGVGSHVFHLLLLHLLNQIGCDEPGCDEHAGQRDYPGKVEAFSERRREFSATVLTTADTNVMLCPATAASDFGRVSLPGWRPLFGRHDLQSSRTNSLRAEG